MADSPVKKKKSPFSKKGKEDAQADRKKKTRMELEGKTDFL